MPRSKIDYLKMNHENMLYGMMFLYNFATLEEVDKESRDIYMKLKVAEGFLKVLLERLDDKFDQVK